jgi:hypothetical protein
MHSVLLTRQPNSEVPGNKTDGYLHHTPHIAPCKVVLAI